jgi:hypothetical protein
MERDAVSNIQGRWTLDEEKGAACPFETCETSNHIKSITHGQIEIFDYNVLKASEIQNSLFTTHNMKINVYIIKHSAIKQILHSTGTKWLLYILRHKILLSWCPESGR